MNCPKKLLTCCVLSILLNSPSHADSDAGSMTILMPFANGSITDVIAREFAEEYTKLTSQPSIVVNRLGAQGAIAGAALANSAGDGRTMMFTSSSLPVLDPLLKKDIPYDPVRDFAPVCTIGRISNVVNIAGASPLKTLDEVVAAAKASPGKLTFAYTSSNTRLAAELFQHNAQITLKGIPYKSSATALTEVASGLVDLMFIDNISAQPFYQSGKLRPLAVLDDHRAKMLADVATAKELGVEGHNAAVWFGLYVSAKTPANVLAELTDKVQKAVESPDILAKLEKRGIEPMHHCGTDMSEFQLNEIGILRDIVTKAGIERQ